MCFFARSRVPWVLKSHFAKGKIKEGNHSSSACSKKPITILRGSRRSLKGTQTGTLTPERWWYDAFGSQASGRLEERIQVMVVFSIPAFSRDKSPCSCLERQLLNAGGSGGGTVVAAVPSARAVGVLVDRLLVLLSRVIGSIMSGRHELHSFIAS